MRFSRTDENEKRVVDTYKRLPSYKAVAEEIGCSWNTVQRICIKHAVNKGQGNHNPGNSGGGSPLKITDEQILEEVKSLTRQEIAEKYGVHVCNLDRRMRRLGVHAQHKSRKRSVALR